MLERLRPEFAQTWQYDEVLKKKKFISIIR